MPIIETPLVPADEAATELEETGVSDHRDDAIPQAGPVSKLRRTARKATVLAAKPSRQPPASLPKVVFIGFSVFQGRGLSGKLIAACEAAAFDVEIVALEGHTIFTVSHLIETLLDRFSSTDAVILDLTTPATRGHIAEAQWLLHLDNIVRAIRSRGIRVGLVHLLRKDVDYAKDDLVAWCDAYCKDQDIPTRNVALELQSAHTAGQIDKLIRDVVHPLPAGDDYYVGPLVALCRQVTALAAPARFDHSSQFIAFSIPKLLDRAPDSAIRRHGPSFELTHLHPGTSQRLELPHGTIPRILLVVYGPQSGPFQIGFPGEPAMRLRGYDANCYYERLAMEYLPFSRQRTLNIEQLSDLPEEKLLKGVPNLGPRLGKLALVLATRLSDAPAARPEAQARQDA